MKETGGLKYLCREAQRYSPARRTHKGQEGFRAFHRRGAKVRNGSRGWKQAQQAG